MVNFTTASPQYTTTFSITWSGSDENRSGLDHYEVEYTLNNQTTVVNTGLTPSFPFPGSGGGVYDFRVRAADTLGNQSNWVATQITVDLSTPSITEWGPTGATNDDTPTISGKFYTSSTGDPVNSVKVSVDGTEHTASFDNNNKTFLWTPSSSLSDGTYQMKVVASNSVGSGEQTWPLTIDTQNPTVTNVAVENAGQQELRVSWNGSDALSGIKEDEVQYDVNNSNNWQTWLTGHTETSALFQAKPGESYTFRVQATDQAGNTSGFVASSAAQLETVTKYYTFGGQKVAMRRGSEVYYLHGDPA